MEARYFCICTHSICKLGCAFLHHPSDPAKFKSRPIAPDQESLLCGAHIIACLVASESPSSDKGMVACFLTKGWHTCHVYHENASVLLSAHGRSACSFHVVGGRAERAPLATKADVCICRTSGIPSYFLLDLGSCNQHRRYLVSRRHCTPRCSDGSKREQEWMICSPI